MGFSVSPAIDSLARAIAAAGGRAVVVGGVVRDHFLGIDSKDYDLEVYGLPVADLEAVLGSFGEVIAIGRAFGVLRVKGIDADISLPRRDSKTGSGHRGFIVELDPSMDFVEAARRRDLTVNAIGIDPLTGEVLDPHGGRRDLERKLLRAVDARTFPEDSLRGLRVAQFMARFEMAADPELHALCAALDLSDLPGERMWEELVKLLLKGVRPSLGFEFLRTTALLRFFPELEAMVGVPQDAEWHPEGTVWEHTLLVVDEAAALRTGERDVDPALLFGALCHDLGKPATTVHEDGRIRSPNHEEEGVAPTETFLARLRCPSALLEKVTALVRHHLAPANYIKQSASPRAFRRLARKLGEVGLTLEDLVRLARADHFGRTTPDALARAFPSGEEFLRRASELHAEDHAVKDVVMGRHLLARGMSPGPHIGELLRRCQAVQEETGLTEPDRIIDLAMAGSEVALDE